MEVLGWDIQPPGTGVLGAAMGFSYYTTNVMLNYKSPDAALTHSKCYEFIYELLSVKMCYSCETVTLIMLLIIIMSGQLI